MKSAYTYLKVAGIILAAALVIFAAGCVSPSTSNTTKNNTISTTADSLSLLAGDWESKGEYSAGSQNFTQVYHFSAGTTEGTLKAKSTSDGKILSAVKVILGYDDEQKAYMAFTPSSGNYDYLILSPDGKSFVSEYGEIYYKLS